MQYHTPWHQIKTIRDFDSISGPCRARGASDPRTLPSSGGPHRRKGHEGRLLYPRPAVTVALMFWGLLWGGIGLVLAIPLTAGLKAACDNVSGLEPYGQLLGD